MTRLERAFRAIRARGATLVPGLTAVRLARCQDADREHAASARQHMHYGHRPRTICHAAAAERLALPWQAGLLAHELGHAVADLLGLDHREEDANAFGAVLLGAPVAYAGPSRLERAAPPAWLRRVCA